MIWKVKVALFTGTIEDHQKCKNPIRILAKAKMTPVWWLHKMNDHVVDFSAGRPHHYA